MLTAHRLKQLLDYNPSTGIFRWKVRAGSAVAGKTAGTPHKEYIRIQVDGRLYRAHRLVWLFMTGEWPETEVDHRNTCGSDNRWENLRLSDRKMNMQNIRLASKNNATGFLGVHRQGSKFRSRIRVNGRNVSLGMFETPEAAYAAYVAAKRNLHRGNTL